MTEQELVTDLLSDAGTLATRLRDAVRDERWLDAYLFAAGLSQLVDDRLHADRFLFRRAASYLRGLPSRPARVAGAVAAGLGAVTRADATPAGRRLIRARRPLEPCGLMGRPTPPCSPTGPGGHSCAGSEPGCRPLNEPADWYSSWMTHPDRAHRWLRRHGR